MSGHSGALAEMPDPRRRLPAARAAAARRVVGAGEMADRIRSFTWERTPIGPISAWSDALLVSVNMMLTTRQPILLLWGPEMILLYNDAFRAVLTDRHPEALGSRGREFWRDVWPVVGQQLEAVLHEGRDTLQKTALVPLLRNGLLEDAWFSYSYSPVYDTAGEVAGIITICQDETASVVAERERAAAQAELNITLQALHAERERLLNVFQQAPIFFALLEGPRHIFTMANSGYMRVIGGRNVLGKPIAEALPEAVAQGYVAMLDEVYATGKPMGGQGSRIDLDGPGGEAADDRYVDFLYQPMREVDGSISGIIVLGVDVTEKKKAEKALLQNEKLAAVGRMAASIAHEINNPLASVTNLLYLSKTSDSLDDARRYLDIADDELRRMTVITNQTLSFNKQATKPRAVTCLELFNSVVPIYQSRMRNCGVTVEKRRRSDRPVVCMDGEIRQVLNNLVSNAIDAMQASGGRLVLRGRNGKNWKTGEPGLVLTVADTGAGIPSEARKRLFEPFFTTKGLGGTGLGLWVSMGIVERHRGALRFRSSGRSGRSGTVFNLFLPFSPPFQ